MSSKDNQLSLPKQELAQMGYTWAGGKDEFGRSGFGVYPIEVNFKEIFKHLETFFRIKTFLPSPMSILDLGGGNGGTSIPLIEQLQASGARILEVKTIDHNAQALTDYTTLAKKIDIRVKTEPCSFLSPDVNFEGFNFAWLFNVLHWLTEKEAYDLFHKLNMQMQENAVITATACTPYNGAHLGKPEEQWVRYSSAKVAMQGNKALEENIKGGRYNKTMTFWSEQAIKKLLFDTGFVILDTTYFNNDDFPNARGKYIKENISFSAKKLY